MARVVGVYTVVVNVDGQPNEFQLTVTDNATDLEQISGTSAQASRAVPAPLP